MEGNRAALEERESRRTFPSIFQSVTRQTKYYNMAVCIMISNVVRPEYVDGNPSLLKYYDLKGLTDMYSSLKMSVLVFSKT